MKGSLFCSRLGRFHPGFPRVPCPSLCHLTTRKVGPDPPPTHQTRNGPCAPGLGVQPGRQLGAHGDPQRLRRGRGRGGGHGRRPAAPGRDGAHHRAQGRRRGTCGWDSERVEVGVAREVLGALS